MAMGQREGGQAEMWISHQQMPKSPGHPFYRRLNQILAEQDFDRFCAERCQKFYAAKMGRPSLAPGVYFRCLLVGYFEGIDSERGIAWRCEDSLSLRGFLGLALEEDPPDHSTLSRTRRLLDVETHEEVFGWVLKVLAIHDLVKGKTLGVDATTLEANAALRSIVRKDTGEGYQDFLIGLAKASGIETPTREDLAKLDRNRKGKGSNDDWEHPDDPDARITKMKDGRTHLAHKAEHGVDLDTGAVLAVTVHPANAGDVATGLQTVAEATSQLRTVADDREAAEHLHKDWASEAVTDKGYHSNESMLALQEMGIRSYVSEPGRGRRNWARKPDERAAVYANRRRIRGVRGRRLLRRRGEHVERTFAHCYETGGMRRIYLRGHENIRKRLLIHIGGFNLGLLMRKLTGVGTPRGLQGLAAALSALHRLVRPLWCAFLRHTQILGQRRGAYELQAAVA
jgi:transposase